MLTIPLQMDSWTKHLEAFKFWEFLRRIFLPSFLRYFDRNHAFYHVNEFSVVKMNFLLNIDTYFYPSL